jgi:hypothetical protein
MKFLADCAQPKGPSQARRSDHFENINVMFYWFGANGGIPITADYGGEMRNLSHEGIQVIKESLIVPIGAVNRSDG